MRADIGSPDRTGGGELRVLYSFPHVLGKAGIGTTAAHQIDGLLEQGVTVDVVCTSSTVPLRGARRVVETLKVAGRRIPHRALGVRRAYAYHDMRAARILRRLHGEFDLVHCWPAACLRTLTTARAVGVPSFREAPSAHTKRAYEDAARSAAAVGVALPKGHHHRHDPKELARELREFAAADYLLVPSPYVERTFLEESQPPDSLILHQYGFTPGDFHPPKRSSNGGGRGLRALFVGRGEPNKGLHLALKAWVDSGAGEDGDLLICGDVLPEYRERIAGLLEHPSVHELGFVDDVGALMRDSEALLLPSLTEGSALVTYEAQAAGCALLVSDAAGAPCVHGEQGLIHEAGDVGALTRHLRQVREDANLLSRLRDEALANATQLTWSAAGTVLAAAYRQGLARSRKESMG
jgi:glycosyltransferase involved in cell wall biosynthesis